MRKSSPCCYFILPCFNEAEGLETTAALLRDKVTSLSRGGVSISEASRIIFVDDGSTDGTWNCIERLHDCDPQVFGGVKLAHNRGHQNALLAGLMAAYESGCDVAISMDADLQDDVNAVDEMLAQYSNGCEIVYAVRSSRANDTWFKRNTAGLFYKVLQRMGAETIADHADYRLMSRQALKALCEYREVNLFLRGIVPTLGFKTGKVYYERGVRMAGESKYPLKKMVAFAVEGITSFSARPLKIVTGLGLISVLIGLGMLVYTMTSVLTGHAIWGWGSLMCSLWLIGGALMLSLGIVGEYIGKIYLETKQRPRYFIERTI